MESMENRDPEMEQSFSFRSCYGFNSAATVVFSGDENDDTDDDDDDDDSYIEIAIEPIINTHKDDFDGDDEDQSCELRISFSSTVQAQESYAKAKTMDLDMEYEIDTPSTWPSSSTFSSSSMVDSSADQWDPIQEETKQLPASSSCRIQKTVKRKIQFLAVNRFLNLLMPSLKVSSEMSSEGGQAVAADTNHLEAVPSSAARKASKLATINSGNTMKFLIKFRALKFRAMLASFMKPCQVNSWLDKSTATGYRGNSSEEPLIKTPIKPFDKWLVPQSDQGTSNRSSSNNNNNKPNYNLLRNGDEMRSRILEFNMESIRGVLDAMNMTKFGRRDTKTRSCPSSSKSSPVQQRIQSENYKMSVRDNSIQAAIAHCKRSLFTPNSDSDRSIQ